MMTKRVVYVRPDGGVNVLVPAPEMFDKKSGTRSLLAMDGNILAPRLDLSASDDEVLDFIIKKDIPPDTPYRIIELENLPPDRYFRNAWVLDSEMAPKVDMPKARVIQMQKIRAVRDAELNSMDRDWMKAIGQKKQKDADDIEAKRQVLRDIPQTFDLSKATTPDELKNLWPTDLPKQGTRTK